MDTTPPSLLEQLRQAPDPEAGRLAWERFVRLYTPLLYHWASRLGAQGHDADDLVQDVLTALVKHLPQFQYDPSQKFRAWLWTVTANKRREHLRRTRGAAQPLPAELAVPDTANDIGEAEYRRYLVGRAMRLMQEQFQPTTWQACWDVTVEGKPAQEVAARLGTSIDAVYAAKYRVLRSLRQQLEGLLD